MEKAWIGLLLVVAAMGGCIGDSGEQVEETDTEDGPFFNGTSQQQALPDDVPRNVTLGGCNEHGGAFPIPQDMFGAELPDGFSYVPFDPAGQSATLIVIGLSCSLAGGGSVGELWGFLHVDPPQELAVSDAVHLAVLGGFVDDRAQVEIYHAWGLGEGGSLSVGDVAVETIQQTPMARAGQTTAGDEGFTIRMTSAVQGEPSPESAGSARLFGIQGGDLTGIVDVDWTDSDAGFDQGEGHLSIEGELQDLSPEGPAFSTAGVAWHFWGDSYDLRFSYTPIPASYAAS